MGRDRILEGLTPVEINKVVLKSGEEYTPIRYEAIMVGVGSVVAVTSITNKEYGPPSIIDCRFGVQKLVAKTDCIICEVWA